MKLNKYIFLICALIFAYHAQGQSCQLRLAGQVKDMETGFPIPKAHMHIEGVDYEITTDSSGGFLIHGLCPGAYHINISHTGCVSQQHYINIQRDTSILILLDHFSHPLTGVTVTGQKYGAAHMASSMNEKTILDNSYQSIGNLMEKVNGVRTLRNGSGLAKPVVHGMYGNRLLLINQGIALSGQQWGNDHSPEIDPMSAQKIIVVKGAAAIAYQGSNLGNVILLENNPLSHEPHMHGRIGYGYEANGHNHGLNAMVNLGLTKYAWRLNGTLKYGGDKHSASYSLTNTGVREGNFNAFFEYVHNQKWKSDIYASTFNTEIGILRGSHISNLTDLKSALTRPIPFYTKDGHSYYIEAPRQKVSHHVFKWHTAYLKNDRNQLDMKYAVQFNTRKEYDIRRSGRSSIPALSIQQWSHHMDVKHTHQLNTDQSLKSGLQYNMIFNTNNPETGVLPLIPDYHSFNTGIYSIYTLNMKKWEIEAGARYDYNVQKVGLILNTVPRSIERINHSFGNGAMTIGATYHQSSGYHIKGIIGYTDCNPGINEWYSQGLHQGVSGIEEGNRNLRKETSFKTSVSIEKRYSAKLYAEAMMYHQYIRQFIYLQPQDELRLTLRGAFPVYQYQSTNARYYGSDIAIFYEAINQLSVIAKYSYIRAMDVTKKKGIVFTPAPSFQSSIKYSFSHWGKIKNIELEGNYLYVQKQNDIKVEQDFLAPPEAYGLLGIRWAGQYNIHDQAISMTVKCDNLTNKKYRDYLNRQRYFADDLGRNISMIIHLTF